MGCVLEHYDIIHKEFPAKFDFYSNGHNYYFNSPNEEYEYDYFTLSLELELIEEAY